MTREPAVPAGAGLCAACRQARRIESDRGSVFVLCGRSRDDDRFPRYPQLPVWRCPGFDPGAAARETDDDRDDGNGE